MKHNSVCVRLVGLLILLNMIYPARAFSYLDPGTGSYAFQILLASILTGLYTIKIFWKRIKEWLMKLFNKDKKAIS
jgi:hypothetical protein